MSDERIAGLGRRLVGLGSMAASLGLIGLLWKYGLDYLIATPLEELGFVIFATFVAALLSGLERVLSR